MRLKTWGTRLSLRKVKIADRPFHLPIWFSENENSSDFLTRINYAPCINDSNLLIEVMFMLGCWQLFDHSSWYWCTLSINQLTNHIYTWYSQILKLYLSTLQSLHIFADIMIPHIIKGYLKIIWADNYVWMEFIVCIYTI